MTDQREVELEVRMSRPNEFVQPTTTIEDLDDRLLRKVFTYLDDYDLACSADLNAKFNRNAHAVISSRYKHERFHISVGECDFCGLPQIGYSSQVPYLLRNFGKFINSMHLHLSRKYFQDILELIDQYCGESLNELSLERIDVRPENASKMRPLLFRLTTLKLRECRWETAALGVEMSSFCFQLEELFIQNLWRTDMDDMSFFDGVAFPKLHTADLRGLKFTTESIRNMLEVNPQLKEIHTSDGVEVTSEILPTIVRYVPQIEKVSFKHGFGRLDEGENMSCLKHLASLKSLRLELSGRSISSFITELAAAHVPLEHLELSDFRSNRTFYRGISQLKKLKKLRLDRGYLRLSSTSGGLFSMVRQLSELTHLDLNVMAVSRTDLAELIRCAPKLRRLHLEFPYYHPEILTEKEYEEILDVVASRAEKCHLEIVLDSPRNILVAPTELLSANEDKLTFICIFYD